MEVDNSSELEDFVTREFESELKDIVAREFKSELKDLVNRWWFADVWNKAKSAAKSGAKSLWNKTKNAAKGFAKDVGNQMKGAVSNAFKEAVQNFMAPGGREVDYSSDPEDLSED
jgi:hypothetical protein